MRRASRCSFPASLSAHAHRSAQQCALTRRAFSLAQVPGLLKVRYIGRTTVSSAAIFGLFLGAGSLLQCGRRQR